MFHTSKVERLSYSIFSFVTIPNPVLNPTIVLPTFLRSFHHSTALSFIASPICLNFSRASLKSGFISRNSLGNCETGYEYNLVSNSCVKPGVEPDDPDSCPTGYDWGDPENTGVSRCYRNSFKLISLAFSVILIAVVCAIVFGLDKAKEKIPSDKGFATILLSITIKLVLFLIRCLIFFLLKYHRYIATHISHPKEYPQIAAVARPEMCAFPMINR